ncbi:MULTISPECIES: hypothetical protein [Planktothrix]|jgi:hypothetical protein|uniref:Uncharacterized protein n=2 Tax=Planktothrix TaxID=54304 RepID=A0A4P5ZBS5_PLAAG|nr:MULTISPECIES: hypothetical protein [Planktothrix]GDZ93456.1 hypothetical protein PA905_12940 [Planktothrix agardhii CCAP 1459/11A]CAC5340977.1 conserved hypothetical protein [Planktothrix rubescens NIVA-CYA 18]CAD5935881.1 hypothetical protein PCC7821_01587 [Planktothrix rubescens NIVA-CYA 18]CAH2572133.1 hypothetical protein PRNO82_01533 [Planktothrix rubescens]
MSRTLDIFVDFPQEIEYLIKELELILALKFELVSDGIDNWYEFRNSTITLTIGKHDFENDHDIKFEEYPYNLSIRSRNISNEFERKKWCDDFASYVFQKLKSTERYRLMLVDDLQVQLEEFVPVVKV